MRRATVLLAIIALLALPAVALAAEQFTADVTVDAEVPAPTVPDDYAGSGMATLTLSDDESSIDYEVTYEGLTGPLVAAHIHYGVTGEAGPVILPLAHGDSPFSGTLTEADFTPADGGPQTFGEALAAMRDGDTYVNLHTEANPPGEIRGQLRLLPDTSAEAAGGLATGTGLGLLMLALAGAAFLTAYRRLAVRPA